MAGPAPVSALIHAAPMVAAGAYVPTRLLSLWSAELLIASATALMGASLLYTAAGSVYFAGLATGLDGAHAGLIAAGVALTLGGPAFQLTAAPFHAWAPLFLECAPLPIAAYLASASKLGGAVAVIWLVHFGLAPAAGLPAGVVLTVLAVASNAVGDIAALVQRRTVALLAWSDIAYVGYVLAPLAALVTVAGREDGSRRRVRVRGVPRAAGGRAFAAVTAVRGEGGGAVTDLAALWRTAPAQAAVLLIAVVGLAGLHPAPAGTFAKIAALERLAESAVWLADVVAAGAVVGLGYYPPLARTVLLDRGPRIVKARFGVAVLAIGAVLLTVSLAPQAVLEFTSLLR